jgi:outer membrane protein OmpA-like peptidoglycan-associated protein
MKINQVWFVVIAIALLSCATGQVAEKPTALDWFQRGTEFEQSNVYEEAIRMYTEAIRLDRYYAEAYVRRGRAYRSMNKTYINEALRDFNTAIDLDPKNAEAYYERGLLNAFSINNENARVDMQTAASLGHKGAQRWLASDREEKGRDRAGQAKTAAVPASEGVQVSSASAPDAVKEEMGKEKGDTYFAPGKYLPSGSEPVVTFDFNMANIDTRFFAVLDEVAMILKEKIPQAAVVLAGHTDNIGTETYNEALSVRRAKAVESYLTGKHGLPADRLIVKGYGQSVPIAPNDTEEGRAKNRRVEILDSGK